jgi:hypothetical protein
VLHVAVVYTPGGSRRDDHSLQCFVGSDQEDVIRRALQTSRVWGRNRDYDYAILVGTLEQEATIPVRFKLGRISRKLLKENGDASTSA